MVVWCLRSWCARAKKRDIRAKLLPSVLVSGDQTETVLCLNKKIKEHYSHQTCEQNSALQ